MNHDDRHFARQRTTDKIHRLRCDVKAINKQIVALELHLAAIDETSQEEITLYGDTSIITAGDPA